MVGFYPSEKQFEKLISAFSEIKAENDLLLSEDTKDAFVHTNVYSSIRKKGKCIVVGGKGSGKTALIVGHYNENHEKYINSQIIKLDYIPFQQLFSFFYDEIDSSLKEISNRFGEGKDIRDFLSPLQLSNYAWKNCITYFVIHKAATALLNDKSYNLDKKDVRTLKLTLEKISSCYGETDTEGSKSSDNPIFFALLIYFYRAMQDIIDQSIGIQTPDFAVLLATITKVINNAFGKSDVEINNTIKTIKVILAKNDKSVFLSVDRIDDYFEGFYRKIKAEGLNTEIGITETNKKKYFIDTILEGLILAVRDIKKNKDLEWVQILFTMPMDKFIEKILGSDLESRICNHVLKQDPYPSTNHLKKHHHLESPYTFFVSINLI